MNFTQFLLGVMTSIVAALVLYMTSVLWSKRLRQFLTLIQGWLLHIDVEYVFRNSSEASSDIQQEITQASEVRLLTGRGNELARDTFSALLGQRTHDDVPFRILLPLPRQVRGATDWTSKREQEIASFDKSFGKGILPEQIETTIHFLTPHLGSDKVELRLYSYPHVGRVLMTDGVAYFTPYRDNAHGRAVRVIKYRAGGDMYRWFDRLFEQLWEDSQAPPGAVHGDPLAQSEQASEAEDTA